MPYYFTCPGCQQRTHGFQYAPSGTSYYNVNCSHCNAGIAWVAGAEVKPAGVPPKLKAIGVGTSDILYSEPGLTGKEPKAWAELLSPHGTLQAYYSQGERSKAYTPLVPTLAKVADGQCEGQCVHWIRRVLQDGNATYRVERIKKGIERSDSDIQDHQLKQTKVGAAVQLTLKAQLASHNEAMPAKREEFEQKLKDMLARKGILMTWTRSPDGNYRYSYNGGASLSQEEWDATLAKVKKARELFLAQGSFYQSGYDALAQSLDPALKSKRPFSGVVATKTLEQKQYSGNSAFQQFAQALCNDSDFHAGSAALIGASLAAGNTAGEAGGNIGGHAIAVHYKRDNELYLFDPNVGVFLCRQKGDLKRSLEKLVNDGWEGKLRWNLTDEYGYSLFERRPSPQAVGIRETPVVTTPSPVTTYYENKQVIPAKVTETKTTAKPTAPTNPVVSNPATLVTTTTQPPTSVTRTGGFRPQPPPQAVTGQASNTGLKATLQRLLDDPSKAVKRIGGKEIPGVRIDQATAKLIVAAKVPLQHGITGDKPAGEIIARAHVEQVMSKLG
jgi:hypothetical protein